MSAASPQQPPLVSVLVPVFNAAPFVAQTIQSLLAQTFTDFEIVAIDDGSTDRSLEVLAGFSDPRLRVHKNEQNLGLISTLNRGVELCRGELIARLDADDIAVPTRLEKQVAFLRAHPRVVLLGSSRSAIDEHGQVIDEYNTAVSGSALIRWKLLTGNFITHSAVVFRKSAAPQPLFEAQYKHAEDYAAWLTLLSRGDFDTLLEPLVAMRWHSQSVSAQNKAVQVQSAMKALAHHIREQYGTQLSETSLALWSAPQDSRQVQKGDDFFFLLRWMNPLRTPFRRYLHGKALATAFVHYHRRLALLLGVHRHRPDLVLPSMRAIAMTLIPMRDGEQ